MKRQNKYFIAVIVSCCIVALSGCDSNSVKVANDQRLVYGTVEKIVGNEIVLARQYESKEEENNTTEEQNQSEPSSSLDVSSEAESTEESESSSSIKEGESKESESSESSETITSDNTEVIIALQLPVGMPIHKEKEEISFTEIEEGDPLKILMEKDSSGIEVPVEAWVAELTEKEKKSLEAEEPTTAVPVSMEQTTGEDTSSEAESSSSASEPITTES